MRLRAQAWPSKAVTIVVPFTPGVTVDISARVVGEQLSKQIGQPVVIENRGGAGGTLGAGIVAKSEPDGHTLLVSGSLGSANAIFANLPYDTLRDFAGVHSLGLQPLVLVSPPDRPFKTLRDLIAAAKAKPGTLNYGSGGIGSATHLAGERIRMSAGIDVQHVPFKGANDALREVMAGRLDWYATPIPSALELIRSGKVVALAVSATKRSSVLPDVPTTVELGLNEFGLSALCRAVRAGEDAARRAGQDPSGGRQGASGSGGEGAAAEARRRADADEPAGVRQVFPRRRRRQHQAGEGGENPAAAVRGLHGQVTAGGI